MRLTLPFQLLLVALASTPSLASPLAAAGSDEVAAFGATDEGDSDAAVVKKRSFENSCNQCQMLASGTILSCNCRRGNGLYSQAELDLNACLANNNGQLVWAVKYVLGSLFFKAASSGSSCPCLIANPRPHLLW
jgi:hypothetical protein